MEKSDVRNFQKYEQFGKNVFKTYKQLENITEKSSKKIKA